MPRQAQHYTACYALSRTGLALAQKLQAQSAQLALHIFAPEKIAATQEHIRGFSSLPSLVAEHFHQYTAHIFIGATGIAVRCIAPHIQHKKNDPAVIVCDEKGTFAISLLSGHMGGANTLAHKVAQALKACPVITTATDTQSVPAIDMLAKEHNCTILDWEKIKYCNAVLIENPESQRTLQVYDPLGMLGQLDRQYFHAVALDKESSLPRMDIQLPAAAVHWRKLPQHPQLLRMTFPALYLGIGCKKGTSKEAILTAIERCLSQANLEHKALACLASVDIKAQESGLVQAAEALGLPLQVYSPEQLAEIPCPTPSGMAAQLFGLENISVSEGAALVAAAQASQGTAYTNSRIQSNSAETATLILPKTVYDRQITIALAVPEHLLPS